MGVKPHVSIILSTGTDRLNALLNTLRSWGRITYPDYDFTLIINCDDEKSKMVYEVVKDKFSFITKCIIQPRENLNRVWLREGKASSGEYVIFALADELLGDYDMIDTMLQTTELRFSINTFFLNELQTSRLQGFDDWLDQPKIIETFPDFWTWDKFQNTPNRLRTGGPLLTHITGAYRTYWDFVGWFRNDEHGYLNLDRDLVVRECCLQLGVVSPMYPCCYHQWHPQQDYPMSERLPGYKYTTEAQARLLEPAELENH